MTQSQTISTEKTGNASQEDSPPRGLGKYRKPDPNEASVGICKQVPLLTATALSSGLGLWPEASTRDSSKIFGNI